MVFAISTGLRLARFNVMNRRPNKPAWTGNFFTGHTRSGGPITVLLPIYVYFLACRAWPFVAPVILVYTLAIAFLMVSRLPVFSGKRVGERAPACSARYGRSQSQHHLADAAADHLPGALMAGLPTRLPEHCSRDTIRKAMARV